METEADKNSDPSGSITPDKQSLASLLPGPTMQPHGTETERDGVTAIGTVQESSEKKLIWKLPAVVSGGALLSHAASEVAAAVVARRRAGRRMLASIVSLFEKEDNGLWSVVENSVRRECGRYARKFVKWVG